MHLPVPLMERYLLFINEDLLFYKMICSNTLARIVYDSCRTLYAGDTIIYRKAYDYHIHIYKEKV